MMTVNPGFGGQQFIPSSLEKIARMRSILQERKLGHVGISVDGGIHPGTIASVAKAGATIAVAGSAVFNNSATIADNIAALLKAVK
jgi:ribulose-phosphate 3-epimerase